MGNTFAKPLFYFKYIEKYWSKRTDYITVPISAAKYSYYKEFQDKVRVIPQGFNFDDIRISDYKVNNVVTFMYAGLFYPKKRDPSLFLEYLTTLDINFKFIVYTDNDILLRPFKKNLKNKLEIRKTIPRTDLMLEMSKMDFLLNIKNKGTVNQSPSKLIDYSLTRRPVLEISTDFTEIEKNIFIHFLNKDYSASVHIKDLSIFNAMNVADQFIKLNGIDE